MYKFKNIILALAVGTLLVACYDEGTDISQSQGTVEVRLTIQTRAVQTLLWNSEDKTEYYENYVDIDNNDYRIYFFSAETSDANGGKLIAVFTPIDVTITEDGTEYTDYTITGRVSDDVATYDSFRVVVLANWKYYPTGTLGTTTIDELVESSSSTFTMTEGFMPSASNLIPFYGVETYTGVSWTEVGGTVTGANLTGNITLLRAVAKVVVETDETISFDSMTIANCNTTGYCAPLGVYTAEACSNYSYTSTLHLYGENNTNSESASLPMTLTSTDETTGAQTWTVYLAEHDNMGYPLESTCSYIDTTRDNYEGNARILFGEYSNYTCSAYNTSDTTGRYNIARNCYYHFSVTERPSASTDSASDPNISNNVAAPARTSAAPSLSINVEQLPW